MNAGHAAKSLSKGENHPDGVMLYTYFKEKPDSSQKVSLTIRDANGNQIRSFSKKAKEKKDQWTPKDSTQLFVWDMRYPDPLKIKGMYFFWVMQNGPKAIPGKYEAVLKVDDDSVSTTFEIIIDPRVQATKDDLQAQFDFLIETRDKLTEVHETINDIRSVRKQIKEVNSKMADKEFESIINRGKDIDSVMTFIENEFYQTKNKSEQDMLNYPIKLNNKLGHLSALANLGFNRPTDQMYELKDEVFIEIDAYLEQWDELINNEIRNYNQLVKDASIDAVSLPLKKG